jgi:hypothetical protein
MIKAETLGSDFDQGPDAFIDTPATMSVLDPCHHGRYADCTSRGSARPEDLDRFEIRASLVLDA